jgi:hypothetical protein
MSYREFGSSRQAMRPLRTMLRGHLPEAAMLDNVMRPDYQYRNGSLSIPGGCRNICGVPSPVLYGHSRFTSRGTWLPS